MNFSRLVTSGVVVACFLLTSCSDAEVDQFINGPYYNAYANMQETATAYGLGNVMCTGRDTDGNGYISCSAQDPQTKQIPSFECSTWLGQGCKVAVPTIRGYQ